MSKANYVVVVGDLDAVVVTACVSHKMSLVGPVVKFFTPRANFGRNVNVGKSTENSQQIQTPI